MSGLHYKKDGTLDMRYKSSRAAVSSGRSSGYSSSRSSGYSSSRSSGYSSSRSSGYSSSRSPSASSALHYKKDGTLDMRYASSRAAVSSGRSSSSRSRVSSSRSSSNGSSTSSSNLHYKKDGTLDMRYASSKAAVRSGRSSTSRSHGSSSRSSSNVSSTSSSNLHYKKDGTLDMRYASSKAAVRDNASVSSAVKGLAISGKRKDGLHYKKDGTLDMRYKSSREFVNSKGSSTDDSKPRVDGLDPKFVTKAGLPDMRCKEARDFVDRETRKAAAEDCIPSFVPLNKHGNPDTRSAIGRRFIDALGCNKVEEKKDAYRTKRLEDESFVDLLRQIAAEPEDTYEPNFVDMDAICPPPMPENEPCHRVDASSLMDVESTDANDPEASKSSDVKPSPKWYEGISKGARSIDYAKDLDIDKSKDPLGRGGFGVVQKAKLKEDGAKGSQIVAVKTLHLSKLNRKEKKSFVTEINALHKLGHHPNIINLVAYSITPPAIVMELVELGSLRNVLYYDETDEIEAKISSGKYKKKIIFGIANGMQQITMARMVMADLKPDNVLLANDFTPKLCDFGLARLRGKSSASMVSTTTESEGGQALGTPLYMDPLLLGDANASEKSDVYSFGILMNEVICEEEPYSENYHNFIGKSPFAATLYAKNGNRPKMDDKIKGTDVAKLIQRCWHKDQAKRPQFAAIVAEVAELKIPSSIDHNDQ